MICMITYTYSSEGLRIRTYDNNIHHLMPLFYNYVICYESKMNANEQISYLKDRLQGSCTLDIILDELLGGLYIYYVYVRGNKRIINKVTLNIASLLNAISNELITRDLLFMLKLFLALVIVTLLLLFFRT